MFKRDYGAQTAFLDFLFNTLLIFVCLFVISFLMIKIEQKPESKDKQKVEFLVTLSWPDENNDDVDLYIQNPAGNLICFRRKEDGLMHLDRDDLGQKNDSIKLSDGSVFEFKQNREVGSLRGIIPGEYCVNVHMYCKREPLVPTKVDVKVEKMNPYSLVGSREITLSQTGQEETALRFILDSSGNVKDVSYELPKSLVKSIPQGF
jgi:hypothetical protein